MSALELQQRGLLELVKNRGRSLEDPYLRRVANSRELAMVRKIALWWRAFALEGQCRFTARLLKRLGCFDMLVASYFDRNPTSSFVEELSLGFLESLHDHGDRLIGAMSQFEHALLKARAGPADICEITWDRHPELLVLALETGGELPPSESDCIYRMRVGSQLPGLIACTRESFPLCEAARRQSDALSP
jgi:hypothetical protein